MSKVMLLKSGGGKVQTCTGLTPMLFPRRWGASAQGDLTQSNPGLQSAPSLGTVRLPLGGCCLCRGGVPTRRACPELPRARGLCEGGAALDTGARARPTWTTAQWCSQPGSHVAVPAVREEGQWASAPQHRSPGLFQKPPGLLSLPRLPTTPMLA